jgi:hypothetical protein
MHLIGLTLYLRLLLRARIFIQSLILTRTRYADIFKKKTSNIESVTGGVYSINAEYNNHLDENIRVLCNNAFEIPAA